MTVILRRDNAANTRGPILLDVAALAVAFDVKPTRIHKWASRGIIHAQGRDGRRKLYNAADVAALIDNHTE